MITSGTFNTNLPFKIDPNNSRDALSSVFAAAVVNQNFREMLLNNPAEALQQGYLGRKFDLSQKDKSLIISSNAKSLTDLARQVVVNMGL